MSHEWERPYPFGFPAAIENAGSVASPLLAGFSFALVGLIIPAPEQFRWPSGTLVLLLAGGLAFIAAVQCSFWARQFSITPEDIELWRPDHSAERKVALQRLHMRGFRIWARRFNLFYRTGILCLLAGVTLALIPPGAIGTARSLAIVVAAVGFLGEFCWVAAGWLLAGSPGTAYDTQPDEPRSDVRALRFRRWAPGRKIARAFIPLVRVDTGIAQDEHGRQDGHEVAGD